MMPADDMGKGNLHEGGGSLTDADIKHMADQWQMSEKEALEHIRVTIDQKLSGK